MFVDEAEIYVMSGSGGAGCNSFRRERCRPKGGPDGGNGGDGGDVYIEACPAVETLLDFAGKHHWRAEKGRPGEGSDCRGRNGEDVIIKLPVGTLVYDRETGILLKDLSEPGILVKIAGGGQGGRGNKTFATPTHQAPVEFDPGEPGIERWLSLKLKLIADVGFVGLPNAGKSTLLSVMSKAAPKIASYPFTTLRPQLGICELSDYRRIVLADIPGLIEGAHEGAGLGDEFLRHIERTRVIVHLVDAVPMESEPGPLEAYRIIRGELAKFSDVLASKPEIVAVNKMDVYGADEAFAEMREALSCEVLPISAVSRIGLEALGERMWRVVGKAKPKPAPSSEVQPAVVPPHLRDMS